MNVKTLVSRNGVNMEIGQEVMLWRFDALEPLADLMLWSKTNFKGNKKKQKKPMHIIKELQQHKYENGDELKSLDEENFQKQSVKRETKYKILPLKSLIQKEKEQDLWYKGCIRKMD